MTETKEQGQTVAEEIAAVDQEIERLEAEERRRLSRPRPIVALKIKRLELQKRQTEAELEPLRAEREAAGKKLERLRKKRLEIEDEILAAQAAWGDHNTRIEKKERRLRDLDRQIAELRGES
jgi:chromosome segregation ATPase